LNPRSANARLCDQGFVTVSRSRHYRLCVLRLFHSLVSFATRRWANYMGVIRCAEDRCLGHGRVPARGEST
jgi:hypothetical protein